MNLNALKRKLAIAADAAALNRFGHYVQRKLFSPFIRAVNYHDVTFSQTRAFEEHLKYYANTFENVSCSELFAFLADGTWEKSRPGLIISFDDGLRSHSEIVAPLLEKYRFTGWFFVPSGLVNDSDLGNQGYLTVDQLRSIASKHVIGSHTVTHRRLAEDVTHDDLKTEIVESRRQLELMIGRQIDIFCWVGGEEFTYTKAASDLIRSTYKIGFMTNNAVITAESDRFQLQRTNIECENPLSLVRFQLSGFMDLLYFPKRRRVNRITS